MAERRFINTFDALPLVLTVEQVGAIMGISRVGAYELAKSRGFPSIRVGRRIAVPKSSFIKWMEDQAEKQEN